MKIRGILVPLVAGALSTIGAAQTIHDTFDGGTNMGGWTFNSGSTRIESTGGNPGYWLHEPWLGNYVPQPRTDGSSIFTGDYRALRVSAIGVDLITHSTAIAFQRELTLILRNDNGTPHYTPDDCEVYFLGTDSVPQPGTGWKTFDYAIDAQSLVLPPGWYHQGACSDPDVAWNTVIQNVTRVTFYYGDPTVFHVWNTWDIGLDNARITLSPDPLSYCRPKVNSLGCTPRMTSSGIPSATSPSPFDLGAIDLINNKNLLLFYGFTPAMKPFQGGTLCVLPPLRRTAVLSSGGNPPPNDCSGTFAFDFNAWIQGGFDPALITGVLVFAQTWSRDPASPSTTSLTDAVMFAIQP